MDMKELIAKVVDGKDLTEEEARRGMEILLGGEATQAQIGAFLTCPSGYRSVSASRKPLCLPHERQEKIQCVDAALQLCREGIRGAGETVRHG